MKKWQTFVLSVIMLALIGSVITIFCFRILEVLFPFLSFKMLTMFGIMGGVVWGSIFALDKIIGIIATLKK